MGLFDGPVRYVDINFVFIICLGVIFISDELRGKVVEAPSFIRRMGYLLVVGELVEGAR